MTQTRLPQRSPNSLRSKPSLPTSPPQSQELPRFSESADSSRRFYFISKRVLDIGISSVGLVVLSPVFATLAIAIKIDSPGSIFIKQTRVGLKGKPFPCFKFRSMFSDAEQIQKKIAHLNERSGPIFKIKDDPRKTRMGKFIRKYSLDELPQLLNVLRGEMSLVGPRPPLPNEVALYQPHHYRRLEVIPGITGLQQVTARDESNFERWVALDVQYIESQSFFLDLLLLLRTLPAAISGKGAS